MSTLTAVLAGSLIAAAASRGPAPEVVSPDTGALPGCGALAALSLQEAGVSPRSLAAIGVSDEIAARLIALGRASCEASSFEITQELAEREELSGRIQEIEQRVRAGTSAREDREQLASDREAMARIVAAHNARIASLEQAVVASLPELQQEMLRAASRASHTDVPFEFRFSERSDSEWIAVRDHPDDQEHATDTRAQVARLLLSSRAGAIQQVWGELLAE